MFHASEGGPVSVGRPKFQSRSGATPTPAPQNRFEAVPVGIPGYRTDRISRIGGMTPVSSPAPASITEIVLSKTSLAGICLIAFACGIVTTVMVDRAPSRGSEHEVATRQPEPAAAPVATARVAAPPTAAAPLAQVHAAPAPTAAAPTAPTAGEPVVVQMPNLAEMSGAHTTVALRSSAPASSRPSARQRPAAAASAKAAAVPAKGAAAPAKVAATALGKKSKTSTAGAPASKWIDPFSE